MTNTEFSNGFDTLINSYKRFKDFDNKEVLDSIEFNEYEKSFFLTQAQEELVTILYNGDTLEGKSFEETEQMRRLLDSLVKTVVLSPYTEEGVVLLDSTHTPVKLPTDVMFITTEQVKYTQISENCFSEKQVEVVPITQDEYNRIKDNPFRGATNKRVLRLDAGTIDDNSVIELVSKYSIESYTIRYLAKPTPIVLETLTDGLSINGIYEETSCSLNSQLHKTILERAVLMALRTKGINTDK